MLMGKTESFLEKRENQIHTSDHTQELTQNESQIKIQKPKPLIVSLLT